ncbi:MAG: tRNA (5-methylaminomethyl-2-thiouridine)(34)-methyltransferase MnmD, partial [Gammaproteobacteria bacterium]|nr:tRNA (5-methylaminomethyl-2-thiouridine)(34)-methyltransferase MnmD [Gammaproteobacteria bacterium]
MKYAQIEWNNGTPRSAAFDDVYFSEHDGIEETRHVFLQQNDLPQRWLESGRFVIAETGFGTGLNFLVTMQAWLQSAPTDACLYYISIENQPVSPEDIRKLAVHWPELESPVEELLRIYPPPLPGMHLLELAQGRVRLHLIFDEVTSAIAQINTRVDAWYLDGFAPSRNPEMWNARVYELIGRNTPAGGSFATYTAAGDVRRGLSGAGFVVQKCEGSGAKRDMLKGFKSGQGGDSAEQPWYSLPVVSHEHNNAVIIGAGLAGLSCAWSLVRRGWRVTVIDRQPAVANGASGNPAGLLMPRLTREPGLDACFYANACLYAIQCLDRLQGKASESFWFKTGNVLVDEEARLKQLADSYACGETFIRYVVRDNVEHDCGIDIDHDVLLFVNAGWVRVKQLCEQLVRACGDRLEFVHADVTDIRRVNDSWQLCSDQQARLASTDCVVVANAAMAQKFSLLQWLPLRSSRGQLTQVDQTGA